MAGRIRLLFDEELHALEIHQEGVDIDHMAIGRILDVAEILDERKTRPELSKTIHMIKALGPEGKVIVWFWAQDIESLKVLKCTRTEQSRP